MEVHESNPVNRIYSYDNPLSDPAGRHERTACEKLCDAVDACETNPQEGGKVEKSFLDCANNAISSYRTARNEKVWKKHVAEINEAFRWPACMDCHARGSLLAVPRVPPDIEKFRAEIRKSLSSEFHTKALKEADTTADKLLDTAPLRAGDQIFKKPQK